jgi:hypothetical protein
MADLAVHIEAVARRLLGPPNKRLSDRRKLRFGKRGSLVVHIAGRRRGLTEINERENEVAA